MKAETSIETSPNMTAGRVHHFGGIDAIHIEQIPRPVPAEGEVLVRVKAAGVGPWDALIRTGNSGVKQDLPLTLGSDIAGVVVELGPGVTEFELGDTIFGVTNPSFTGGYAEFAIARAAMIAGKPASLSFVEAASVPVVATTAWQMLHLYAGVGSGKTVLVLGASGSVGAYAVQLAKLAGATVIGTAFPARHDFVRSLGADEVIDASTGLFPGHTSDIDIVIDTVGGAAVEKSFDAVRRGGVVVTSVAPIAPQLAAEHGVEAKFFIVEVTTQGLQALTTLIDQQGLKLQVGEILNLSDAQEAHRMLAGAPHKPGKIVLAVDRS